MKLLAYQYPGGVTFAGTDVPGIIMWVACGCNPKPIYAINIKPKEISRGSSTEEERGP